MDIHLISFMIEYVVSLPLSLQPYSALSALKMCHHLKWRLTWQSAWHALELLTMVCSLHIHLYIPHHYKVCLYTADTLTQESGECSICLDDMLPGVHKTLSTCSCIFITTHTQHTDLPIQEKRLHDFPACVYTISSKLNINYPHYIYMYSAVR